MSRKKALLFFLFVLLAISRLEAQFALLHSFAGSSSDGRQPMGSLIASGSTFYGMTEFGGIYDSGTIFKINSDGSSYSILHSFMGGSSDGMNPYGSLILIDSSLYGLTYKGGSGGGTLFKMNTDGSEFTVLHSFKNAANDGYYPYGSLLAIGTTLYGMTYYGGSSGSGIIFKMSADGTGFSVIHSFAGGNSDGSNPCSSLITSGAVLYGMTLYGGTNNWGTIFNLNIDGSGFNILHVFSGSAVDGKQPRGSLFCNGPLLFGTTTGGGQNDVGTLFKINNDGSGFALLHSFDWPSDGYYPYGSLIGLGSVLYGTAMDGGLGNSSVSGMVFQINTDGLGYKIIHTFADDASDGMQPHADLIMRDSKLFGTTTSGGAYGHGVVFSQSFLPVVTTTVVSSISSTTASSGGTVTPEGGAAVTERGVCVSTFADPTLANAHTHDGTGAGAFTSTLTGCTPATTYHVRAYATNSMGTAYGGDLTFTTLSLGAAVPTVTTTAISSLTKTSFTTGGNVTSGGSAPVTERGVCVSTAPNPTMANAHTHDGAGTGVFMSSLTGCTPGETYHVRAYATSTVGTAYGNDIWFQTLGGSKSDFNADGQSDILWRNMTTGENAVWFMGYTATGVANLQMTGLQNMFPGAVRETGDLFKGKPGIVYLDPREGTENANPTTPPAISREPMGARGLDTKPSTSFSPFQGGITILGLTRTSVISLPSLTDFNWVLAGTGDFNEDGWPDLVLRNMVTGENGIWYIVNGTKIGADYMPSVLDLNWKIVGTGDFNGDKKPDLVWRNSATGENVFWYMNGTVRIGAEQPPSVTDQNWTIVGTGDFNGDGKPDFLWHNVVTGENYIWFMDGATKIGGDSPPMVSDVNWQIGGVDDFNGDGLPDILWRNYVSGENGVWYMNGASRIGTEYVPTITDLAWKIVNR